MQNKKNIAIILFLLSLIANGQQTNDDEVEPVPDINFSKQRTNNVENQILNPVTLKEKEVHYLKIRKSNTKHTYIGNMCAEETTKQYHFVYEVDHVAGMSNKLRYFVGNQFKIFYLTFKNGIFWRVRFKRDLKNCISRTGDYVG
jgi:hypothetical protein